MVRPDNKKSENSKSLSEDFKAYSQCTLNGVLMYKTICDRCLRITYISELKYADSMRRTQHGPKETLCKSCGGGPGPKDCISSGNWCWIDPDEVQSVTTKLACTNKYRKSKSSSTDFNKYRHWSRVGWLNEMEDKALDVIKSFIVQEA